MEDKVIDIENNIEVNDLVVSEEFDSDESIIEEGGTEDSIIEEGDEFTGEEGGFIGEEGGFMEEGGMDIGGEMFPELGTEVKDPLMSSWYFVGGITVAVLAIGIILGVFLAKIKIKKGIELYED